MRPETINNALRQMWRDKETGWEFAWAILHLRGESLPKQRKSRPRFKRRELPRLILEALSNGPKEHCAIAAHVSNRRPEIVPTAVGRRVQGMLYQMKVKGLVKHEGQVWRLAKF